MDRRGVAKSRRDARRAVRAQTVRCLLPRRLWIVRRAWYARMNWKVGNERALLSPVRDISKKIVKNPDFFSEIMKGAFSSRLRERLRELGSGAAREPYLVVRGAYPTCKLLGYSARLAETLPNGNYAKSAPRYDRARWYLKRSTYDLISNGLIAHAQCTMRDKRGDGRAYREYFTSDDHQVSAFDDGGDLHLRFRQATPELYAGSDIGARSVDTLAARLVLFVCVENPIREPLFVLPVSEVIERLDTPEGKAALDALLNGEFESFDNWGLDDLKPRLAGDSQPLLFKDGLADGSSRWRMSFDPNRMNVELEIRDRQKFRLVGALLRAIHEASEQARPVVLHRGDALIVHNHLALVRRKEQSYHWLNVPTWGRPAVRWLRVYYGFPPAKPT